MVLIRIRAFAQLVGFVTIIGLAIYGAGAVFQNATQALGAESQATTRAAPVEVLPASTNGAMTLQTAAAAAPTVPLVLNYQGTLRDAEGEFLSGSYNMTFRIYDDITKTVGAEIWIEEHLDVTVRSGQFSVLLGDNTPLPATLFTSPDRFLGVTVAGFDEMAPRQRFASVPYAMHADRAVALSAPDGDPYDSIYVDNDGRVGIRGPATLSLSGSSLSDVDNGILSVRSGGPVVAFDGEDNVGIGTTDPGYKLDVNGRMRVRQGDDPSSAGIWFYQTGTQSDQAFVGMEDDTSIGFYGAGALWALVMHTTSGDVTARHNVDVKGAITANIVDVKGAITANNAALVKIYRLKDKQQGIVDTLISADQYHCVVADWSARLDFNENDTQTFEVWPQVVNGQWRVHIEIPHNGTPEKLDIDLVCFRTEIAEWVGEPRELHEP